MTASPAPTIPTPWYRVPEMWLIVVLLGATVVGSISLVTTALRHPDAHIVVPDDQPRPSRIPPTHARPDAAKPTG